MGLRRDTFGLLFLALCLSGGCVNSGRPEEHFGKTYYLDGAGNYGFGTGSVREGLGAAGYRGDVEVFVWTTSFNALLDQRNTVLNDLRAAQLAGKITSYLKNHPGNEVNIIALSAGTGVATWAVEKLRPPCRINNLVLLGSSLSCDYDVSKALDNMRGKIYVYYSPYDGVLDTFVRSVGTVDNRFAVDSAGLVGLRPGGRSNPRVVNVGYRPSYDRYGWAGDHTGATSAAFVQRYVAQHVLTRPRREAPAPTALAARRSPALQRAQVVFVPTGESGEDGQAVQSGLRQAGFAGQLIIYQWRRASPEDSGQETRRVLAREATELCTRLESLARQPAAGPINVLAAGWGTGLAVFAIERLDPSAPVHNLVLVGSGLSADYDLRRALTNLTGKIYVYHCEQDQALIEAARQEGTLDGRHGVATGGISGHYPPSVRGGQVINIGWRSSYEADGWDGHYASCLSADFVERRLGCHLLPPETSPPQDSQAGRGPAGRLAEAGAGSPPALSRSDR